MYRPQMPLWKRILMGIAMVIATIWLIFPLLAVITSLPEAGRCFQAVIYPVPPVSTHIRQLADGTYPPHKGGFRGLSNSFTLAISAAAIALIIGTLAGYGLARFRYRRWKNKDIAMWILVPEIPLAGGNGYPLFLDDESWDSSIPGWA